MVEATVWFLPQKTVRASTIVMHEQFSGSVLSAFEANIKSPRLCFQLAVFSFCVYFSLA